MLTIIGSDPRLVLEGFDTEDVRTALVDTLLGLKIYLTHRPIKC